LSAYADSSALVAVYVNEANSARARSELERQLPVPWTRLHDVEVTNALRLLHGRGHIGEGELEGLLGHVDEDLRAGRLRRVAIDFEVVCARAVDLSAAHAPTTLARTLDILHVAALLEAGLTTLISADGRQLAVAEAEGVTTIDIRAPR
jgi:predicted nucleic acid-binding protein